MTWLLAVGLVLLAAFAWRFYREPRRLSNGLLLLCGLAASALALMDSYGTAPIVLLVMLSPLLVLGLAGALIGNGVIVLRRERFSLSNALSLLAGIGILAVIGTIVGSYLLAYREQVGLILLPGLSLLSASAYIGFVFTMVTLYAVVYSRFTPRPGHTGIIVLGAGVPRGTIPPLLASRLDKAIQLYRREVAAGHTPLLVASGGQGPDEPVPEARAMAGYLHEHGIPEQALVEEDRSRSTRENLIFSRRLLAERDADRRLLIVTSSYHVLRAAVQSRRLRLPAQVVGATTARYYVPNAFLREFVALLAENKVLHTVMVLLMIAAPALLYLG